jgi:hypothetical protein
MLILASKRAYIALFGAKKSDMEKKRMADFLGTESYNALFDAKKCDIGPKNAYI